MAQSPILCESAGVFQSYYLSQFAGVIFNQQGTCSFNLRRREDISTKG